MQLSMIEDRGIKNKDDWEEATKFMISTLENNLKVNDLTNIIKKCPIQFSMFHFLVNRRGS